MEKGGVPAPKVHDTCILAMGGYEQLCEELNARPVQSEYWSTFLSNGDGITIAKPGMGAPMVVMRCEEIIALGVKRFLFMGSGGSLKEEVPIGSIVLPVSAVVDEGTSSHYVGKREQVDAPGALNGVLSEEADKAGIDVVEGIVWTTDAPYREMKSKAERLSRKGVVAVEMECSALFALGEFRDVEVGGFVVISDTLFPEWRFSPEESKRGWERARKVMVSTVKRIV